MSLAVGARESGRAAPPNKFGSTGAPADAIRLSLHWLCATRVAARSGVSPRRSQRCPLCAYLRGQGNPVRQRGEPPNSRRGLGIGIPVHAEFRARGADVITIRRAPKPDRAGMFAEWLADTFKIPAGISQGRPFELHAFQREFVRAFLSRDLDGPTYRTCIFSTPRKLGKSTLLGSVLLGVMCPDSPIYIPHFSGAIAAPTEKHTGYIAQAMVALLETAGREKELHKKTDPKPGKLLMGKGVCHFSTGNMKQGHGADLDLAVIDEAGLLSAGQAELINAFYDALASKDGQLVLTGTRGDSPEYNRLIAKPDKRTHVTLYGADLNDDASDPKVWAKANPGLGEIKSKRFLQDAYEKAEQGGSLTSFKAWHLNMPLSASRELLIEYTTLQKAYQEDARFLDGEPVFIGLDLGGSAAMTAAVIIGKESGVIRALAAFPGESGLDLTQRGKRDGTGLLYVTLNQSGELFETSGAITDVAEFLSRLRDEIGGRPVLSISGDRYRDAEFRMAMARAKVDWPLITRGTGPKDGDNDIRATRRLFLSGKAKLKRSLLIEAAIAETDVKVSTTGAMQIDRSHRNARIDVAQALCLACSAFVSAMDAPKPEYEVALW